MRMFGSILMSGSIQIRSQSEKYVWMSLGGKKSNEKYLWRWLDGVLLNP